MASITAQELLDRLADPAPPPVLDVRSPDEFRAGHIPGAVNIPFTHIAARRQEIPASADDELVLYCGHGPRAWLAARALRKLGFQRLTFLRGHWTGWRSEGRPIEEGQR